MPTSDIASQRSVNVNNALKISRYRPEIDGLRAFAVVAVIINHFNKDILPGGYLGVDIFFVISGYVITSSLFGRPSKDFKDFISDFYERRIKRLVPALSVFVLITSIATCLFNPSPGLSLRTGLTSLFGLSNLYLLLESTDYFAQSTELNVFTHTWSLGVEEQFYILFPLLIWFTGFGRQTKNGARNLFLVVGTLTIASLIGFLYLYPSNQPAAYFLMPSRFWEMAVGSLIFIGFQKRASIEQFLEKVPPLLVLALIVGVMYLPMSLAAGSTIAVVTLSSTLIASLKKQTALFKVFTHPRVVYIGLISYSLYLWHWGVLSISRWSIGIHWWSVPFQVALMLGLAVASYRWIETPLRRGNWFGKRWKTLVVGGGVLVAVSGGLVAIGRPLKGKLYTGKRMDGIATAFRYKDKYIEPNLSPKFTSNNCANVFNLENCHLKAESKKTAYFLGNSHANHYRESAYLLHKDLDIGVFSITTGWCNFPLNEDQISTIRCGRMPKNIDIQKKVEKHLYQNIQSGDLVIISNRYPININDGMVFGETKSYWLNTEQSIEKINQLYSKLSRKGANLVLMLPSPEFDTPPDLCTKQWFRPRPSAGCIAEKNMILEKQNTPRELVRKFLDPGIHVYDPIPDLCEQECIMIDKNGEPLYIDQDHLTDYANKQYIYPSFKSFLQNQNII